jgi:hypothetical protein
METGRRHQLVQNSITTLTNTGIQGASEEEHYKMCYKVECDKCGKYTWKGCGLHVKSVYDGIEKGKHCACKEWPGVDAKVEGSTSTAKEGHVLFLQFLSCPAS